MPSRAPQPSNDLTGERRATLEQEERGHRHHRSRELLKGSHLDKAQQSARARTEAVTHNAIASTQNGQGRDGRQGGSRKNLQHQVPHIPAHETMALLSLRRRHSRFGSSGGLRWKRELMRAGNKARERVAGG